MSEAKIRLSELEMNLVTNTEWILTKGRILEKGMMLLGRLQLKMSGLMQSERLTVPQAILEKPPKISRGENYRGLPYLILDYPRLFDQKDIFAIRTLLWWGHFFSFTLHLSGKYLATYRQKLVDSSQTLQVLHFHYCVNDSPWEHHFEPANYRPLEGDQLKHFESVLRDKSFGKIACKVDIREWEHVEEIFSGLFKVILDVLFT